MSKNKKNKIIYKMTFTKSIKSLASVYNKCSLWCKVLILTSLLLLVVLVFKGLKRNNGVEGFELVLDAYGTATNL